MKFILIPVLLLLIATSAHVQAFLAWDNPTAPFDAKAKRVHKGPISIEWKTSTEPHKACDLHSKQIGNGGFSSNPQLQACSFWHGSTCTIITNEKPSMHTVGHEVRHCFYGEWH